MTRPLLVSLISAIAAILLSWTVICLLLVLIPELIPVLMPLLIQVLIPVLIQVLMSSTTRTRTTTIAWPTFLFFTPPIPGDPRFPTPCCRLDVGVEQCLAGTSVGAGTGLY